MRGELEERNRRYSRKYFPASDDESFHHYFEWAGLELGFKQAAIFYLPKKEAGRFMEKAQARGYYCELSDFAGENREDHVEKLAKDFDESSGLSVYVSRDPSVSKRLKYIDRFHQLRTKEPKGLSAEELFFEVSRLLGYPRCCSLSVLNLRNNPGFGGVLARKEDIDTLLRILPWKESDANSYLLNNFAPYALRFIEHSVCSYDCKESIRIAGLVRKYLDSHDIDYKRYMPGLKLPFLFFSYYRIIYLINGRKRDGRVFYDDCFYCIDEAIFEGQKRFLREMQTKLLGGDSLEISDSSIRVYKGERLVGRIAKRDRFEGVFVSFGKSRDRREVISE